MATCSICIKRVLNHSYNLTRDFCKGTVHLKCLPSVNKKVSLYTNRNKSVFYGSLFLPDTFAYNRLDDKDFIEALADTWENQPLVYFETLENQELIFSPFDFNDNFDNPLSKNKTSSSCSRFYINDGVNITNDKKVIAEKFTSFFVNVGPNLVQKIPPISQSPTASMIRNINSMAVLPINESEVIDIIKNLKNSSPGWDSISAKVVKALNLKKTHFMLFRKKRGQIALNNDLIIRTNHTKFLGVMVEQHLTFEAHVRYTKGKILLQERKLLTLYYSFVYPYFTYSITVWGNTYPTVLDPLIKCQKRAVRIVHGAGKYDHADPIFQNLKILSLRKLYMYSVKKYSLINIACKIFRRYSLIFYCCQHDPWTSYSTK